MNLSNTFSEQLSVPMEKRPISFAPRATAVILVDMLNEFFSVGGLMVLEGGNALYEPVRRLLEQARRRGSPVFWTNQWLEPDDGLFRIRTPHCIKGTWGAEIVPDLEVAATDIVLHKRRYSAFFQTDLDMRLREHGIDTVIVAGVVTNICVRSTVNDAFFLGYHAIVPEQCVMATSPEAQAVHLYDIHTHYGDVASVEDVLRVYEASAEAER